MIKLRSKTGLVLLAAFLILAVSLTVYITKLADDLKSELNTTIVQNTVHNSTVIASKFNEKFTALTALADFIGDNGSINDNSALSAMHAITKSGQFSHVSIADMHGDSITETGVHSNVISYDFFEASISGRKLVANETDLPMYTKNQLVFSVPVYRNKMIVGVLYGITAIDQNKDIDISVPANGYCSVIKRDGTIVFNLYSKALQSSENNLFTVISGGNQTNKSKVETMRKNIGLSLSGLIEYQMGNSINHLYYNPLSASDWYFVTVIPNEAVLTQFKYRFADSGFLVLGVAAAFALLGIYSILLLRRRNSYIKKNSQELKALTENIPGCVKRCRFDSNLTMIYFSDGFLQLTGYTREEVKEHFENKYINMIYEYDRKEVRANIDTQLQTGEVIDLQYRLCKKDGSLVWIIDKGQLMIENSRAPEFYSVLLDITNLKEIIQELEISNERYQIVMDQSDSVIFEYNILEDVITMGRNSQNLSGGSFKAFLQNVSHILYPEDMACFQAMFAKVRAGAQSADSECRLKNKNGSYMWYDIKITTIFNNDDRPIRAIGTISDITFQKEATQTLVQKTQRDGLTGLLNKATTQTFIEEALKDDDLCALYMIDVDYFKNVNDSLGHVFGDSVLADIGSKLKKLFRSSDIVGRIGGDEFMVLLKNIRDTSLIAEKAESINQCLRQTFDNRGEQCTISGSVGIAIYPKDGKTYADLYEKADIALYKAKRAGRDRYNIYNEADSIPLGSSDECHNKLTPTLETLSIPEEYDI